MDEPEEILQIHILQVYRDRLTRVFRTGRGGSRYSGGLLEGNVRAGQRLQRRTDGGRYIKDIFLGRAEVRCRVTRLNHEISLYNKRLHLWTDNCKIYRFPSLWS